MTPRIRMYLSGVCHLKTFRIPLRASESILSHLREDTYKSTRKPLKGRRIDSKALQTVTPS